MSKQHAPQILQAAVKLASKGYNKREISKKLNIPYSTVSYWSRKYKWEVFINDPMYKIRIRLNHLLSKSRKNKHDYKEIEFLHNLFIKFESARETTFDSIAFMSMPGD